MDRPRHIPALDLCLDADIDDDEGEHTSSTIDAGSSGGGLTVAHAGPGPRLLPTRLSDWNPSRRPQRHIVRAVPHGLLDPTRLDGPKDPADWTLISVQSAEDLGHVRNGMTYDKDYTTSCTFYEKPARLQFMEGPNEPAVGDHLELNPRALDFQFQSLDMVFRRRDGKIIHKYPDILIETDRNVVLPGEIKSNKSWFEAPGVARPLAAVEDGLLQVGLEPLLRIRGEAFLKQKVLEAHRVAMDARLTEFDDGEVATVRATLAAGRGRTFHGCLVEALGGERNNASDKLYAMLLRRIVSFDLWTPPSPGTLVGTPRRARAYALRELLARFRPQAD